MANAMVIEPSAIPGIQRFFCSSVPNLLMMVPLMAGETTISSRAQPAADISSMTIDSSYMPAPPPPYSSGRLTPMKPSLPASFHNSVGVLAGAGLLEVVVLAVVGGHCGDGLAQLLLFVGLDETRL